MVDFGLNRTAWVLCVAGLLYSAAAGQELHSKTPDEIRRNLAPLSMVDPLPAPDLSTDELVARFDLFPHEPFDRAGINPFVLPFRYRGIGENGAGELGYAMSFLLSYSLDWIPGNYSARHFQFVAHRSAKSFRILSRKYDGPLIGHMVEDWDATIAVGGELRRGPAGFTATLEMYNNRGERVFTQEFETPRPFFDLLGDLTVAVMEQAGYRPGEALVKELHRVRCSEESLRDLQATAFEPERSQEEFGLFDRILRRDPDFADVRAWLANQFYWESKVETEAEDLRSLQSYPTIVAVKNFNQFDDAIKVRDFEKELGRAERLAPDHPAFLEARLSLPGEPSEELLRRALRTAATYPNEYNMLGLLASIYERMHDNTFAAALALTEFQNRYLTGVGHRFYSQMRFVSACHSGRFNQMAIPEAFRFWRTALKEKNDHYISTACLFLERALFDAALYDNALDVFLLSAKYLEPGETRQEAAAYAAVSSLMAGNLPAFDKIVSEYAQDFQEGPLPSLLPAFRAMALGEPYDIGPIRRAVILQSGWYQLRVCFLTTADLHAGKQDFRPWTLFWMSRWRPGLVLYDAYDRQTPKSSLSANVYAMIDWLYCESPGKPAAARKMQSAPDPWAVKALADFRKRQPRAKPLSLARVEKLLSQMEAPSPASAPASSPASSQAAKTQPAASTALPPGVIFVAVEELIGAGKEAQARELLLRYRKVVKKNGTFGAEIDCNWLLHVVDDSRHSKVASSPAR